MAFPIYHCLQRIGKSGFFSNASSNALSALSNAPASGVVK